MKKHCELSDRECIQNKIAGLGEKSFRKSYYPEFQKAERFKALLDQSNDAIFLLSIPDGIFVDINYAVCEQLGYDRGSILKRSIYDVICDSADAIQSILWGKVSSIIFRSSLCGQTGNKVCYEINARKVYFGGKAYAIMVARNIEKRLLTERALRESEEKFRVLAETSSAVIYVYQGENLVYVNEAAERITGYSKDELLKMKFWDIIHPDYKELVKERGLARQSGGAVPSRYEIKFITKTGEERCAELDAGNITYMDKPAGVATFFDITERKRAEEKLLLTQFAVDSFTDSSIWLNAGGKIIYVNRNTCQKLGYTRDELLSMMIWDIDPNYAYDKYREKWEMLKKKGYINFESSHIRKDGISYPVEVSANYIKFEDCEYEVAFDRDITERKQKEKELSDTKAQVELYLDLMGHDINNINQIALGYLELADNVIKSGGKVGEQNIELIEKPIASLNNGSRLIDKVNKLRRLKAREIRLEQVDVREILAKVKDKYSHVVGRDITINYIPPAECLVMANELIEEIFINLVENSIKHTHKDKPLVIDIIQAIVCENGKEYFRISIDDNGPGISDEVKKKLFSRFSRGETKAKGKGLGLYLVKALVEDFQGRIWVEDRVAGDHSKGVKFVVMLPTSE
jgi:PAS domain S-box-containing protein